MSDVDEPQNTDAEIKGEGETTINHHERNVSLSFSTDCESLQTLSPPEFGGKHRNKSKRSFDGLGTFLQVVLPTTSPVWVDVAREQTEVTSCASLEICLKVGFCERFFPQGQLDTRLACCS